MNRVQVETFLAVAEHMGKPDTPWTPVLVTPEVGQEITEVDLANRNSGETMRGRPPIMRACTPQVYRPARAEADRQTGLNVYMRLVARR